MIVPDITYRYMTATDTSGPTFEILTHFETITSVAIAHVFTLTGVPKDRVLLISNVQIEMNATGTESAEHVAIFARTPAGATANLTQEQFPVVQAGTVNVDWQGQIFVGGSGADNTILQCNAVYDAGVLTKTSHFSVFGVMIPRGNIAPR